MMATLNQAELGIPDSLMYHAPAGEFCPTCDTVHCIGDDGHDWNEDDRCKWCGADGRT